MEFKNATVCISQATESPFCGGTFSGLWIIITEEEKSVALRVGGGLKYPVVCQHYGYWFYFSRRLPFYVVRQCSPSSGCPFCYRDSRFSLSNCQVNFSENFSVCYVSLNSNQSRIVGAKGFIWRRWPRIEQSKPDRVNTIGNYRLNRNSLKHVDLFWNPR